MSVFRQIMMRKKENSDYIFLEYIKSTGTQYINTGINNWNNTLEYSIKLSIEPQGSGTYTYFGCWNEWNTNGRICAPVGTYTNYRVPNSFVAGYDSSAGTDIGISNWQTGTLELKGNTISWSEGSSISFDRGSSFTTNVPIILFGCYTGNYVSELSSFKLYGAKFWLNGSLIRDFVPVQRKIDREIGVLDRVSGTFYGNAGTGSFIAKYKYHLPSNLQQVDYIKSTRTQYIVTDYKPKNNTYVETYVRFSGTFKDTETYGGNGNLFGSGSDNKTYGCNFGGGFSEYNRIYFWVTPYNGSSSVRYIINDNYNQIQKIAITSSLFVWGSTNNYKQTSNSDSNVNLCLFGYNKDGTAVPFTCYDMEIHNYFEIWEGEDLVRNYIPVYNTIIQKYGLYDTVTKTFVGNSGTGDFSGGND